MNNDQLLEILKRYIPDEKKAVEAMNDINGALGTYVVVGCGSDGDYPSFEEHLEVMKLRAQEVFIRSNVDCCPGLKYYEDHNKEMTKMVAIPAKLVIDHWPNSGLQKKEFPTLKKTILKPLALCPKTSKNILKEKPKYKNQYSKKNRKS